MLLGQVGLAATDGARPLQSRPELCGRDLLAAIPARPANAPGGREFARQVWSLSGPARDALIVTQLEEGNIPPFLRHLIPVTVRGETPHGVVRITVCVLPDYLAVGSDTDFLYVPLGLKAALAVAGRFGDVLPTPKLVDAIYAASPVKLVPEPLTASDAMRSTAYVLRHTELIDLQRALYRQPLGTLTSGNKKDLVLTDRLWESPGRVAIYGWQRASGRPIQPLSTVHGERYADYSHGIRLVSRIVYVNGVARRMDDVLADSHLAPLLSREGRLRDVSARLATLAAGFGT
jgi:hypothetical protein